MKKVPLSPSKEKAPSSKKLVLHTPIAACRRCIAVFFMHGKKTPHLLFQ